MKTRQRNRHQRSHRDVRCALIIALLGLAIPSASEEIRYVPNTIVVEAGMTAPTGEIGAQFGVRPDGLMAAPSPSKVVFEASILPPYPGLSVLALAEWTPDGHTVLLYGEHQAPGMPEGVISSGGGLPQANAAGDVAALASLRDTNDPNPTSLGGLYFRPAGGEGGFVAIEGAQLPHEPTGSHIEDLDSIALNAAGQCAFTAAYHPGGDAVWEVASDGVRKILGEGDPAPTYPAGTEVRMLYTQRRMTRMNDRGEIPITAFVRDMDALTDPHFPLWRYRDGEFIRIMQEFDPFPKYGPGTYFYPAYSPSVRINNRGNVLFQSQLHNPDFDYQHIGLFLYNDLSGVIEELAAPGPVVWEDEEYRLYAVGGTLAQLNDHDEVFFGGGIEGPGVDDTNEHVLCVQRAGKTVVVAREGMHVEGLPDGVVIDEFKGRQFNGTGMVVFAAALSGGGLDHYHDTGLFVTDYVGNVRLLFQEGDLFDVLGDGSDCRTISQFSLLDPEEANNGRQCLLDDYQLAMTIPFLWGRSALFLLDLSAYAPPPCPGDLNHDRRVDQRDLGELLVWYGRDKWGDLDGDGDTDTADLGILLSHYEATCE